jgi:hypothetical protein
MTAVPTRDEDAILDRGVERAQILDALEQGINDAMDCDTHASDWARGALDALLAAGFQVKRVSA